MPGTINCRNCHATYSDDQEVCPSCGYRPRKKGQTTFAQLGPETKRPSDPKLPNAAVPAALNQTPVPTGLTPAPIFTPVPALTPAPVMSLTPPPFAPDDFSSLAKDLRRELDTLGRVMKWVNERAPKDLAKRALPAASQGNVDAMLLLAFCLFGEGGTQHPKEALPWLSQAANNGDGQASTMLGYFYAAGLHVKQNMTAALKYYEQGAARGSANAANNLGTLYENGSGVAKDPAKARAYYEQAANAGLALGKVNLARLLRAGVGGAKDVPRALEMLKKAGETGEPAGWLEFAEALIKGDGVPVDRYKAAFALNKAADLGSETAAARLAELGMQRKQVTGKVVSEPSRGKG